MSAPGLHPQWLANLRATARQAPRRPRLPLLWQGTVIGSVEADFFDPISGSASLTASGLLSRHEGDAGPHWRLTGELTAVLAQLAQALLAARVAHVQRQWRNEQLAVCNANGQQIGTVERETWEEAGLRLADLVELRRGGQVELRKPCFDDASGYVVELADWYHCRVPDGVQPVNQDGEVARFDLLDRQELVARLHRDEFTTEAALVLVSALCGQAKPCRRSGSWFGID